LGQRQPALRAYELVYVAEWGEMFVLATPQSTIQHCREMAITILLVFRCFAFLCCSVVVGENSLQVTETTYSGLQEHRSIMYTATGQKAKPKERMSTEVTGTGNLSKTPEACRREAEEHKLTSQEVV
jgi:succinate-acetate transporter protein